MIGESRRVRNVECTFLTKTVGWDSLMRLEAVVLPDLGTGPDETIVVSHWFAARGEIVWEGDKLVEVVVGAATFDVPAPKNGRLARVRLRTDDLVPPGAVLGLMAVSDEDDDFPGPSTTSRKSR